MAGEAQTNTDNNPAAEQRHQWLFFGILAAIMLGTILVIALLRPFIFGRVVPAIMGDFNTPTPAELEEPEPADTAPTEEAPDSYGHEADKQNEVFIPAAASGTGDDTDTTSQESSEPVEEAAPVKPSPAPVTYTIQSGDTLTAIAKQYNITVETLMAANNLANADYISVGQVLTIPGNK